MSNTKVYLAKSHLASGLDVEYVKSNLSRIKGIDIVESGMGINPSECASMVIVNNSSEEASDVSYLTKSTSKEVKEFLKNHSAGDDAMLYIYLFVGKEESESGDVEDTTPLFDSVCDYETIDKESFDKYGQLSLNECAESLLGVVSDDINAEYTGWKNVPRHYVPEPKFAMPPVPTLEERRLKKSAGSSSESYVANEIYSRPVHLRDCYKITRPLLGVRKRRRN